ncbi:MAG: SDR family NAD(P)-dependent oxidoreductase [Hyphomicrobiaceae bacterium]|jgi:NAD(P)-dependent dehydrogenase (short-subunit alcohol dehydrogenase family)
MRFKNQGVLVTGAGSGIGRETAHAFAAEGAHIGAADIDLKAAERTVEEIRQKSGSARAFSLDVTDEKSVASYIESAVSQLGRIDVLVNSAGLRQVKPVLELSLQDWNRVMDVNITGVFLCSQAFARHLVRAGKPGAIVNLASTLGFVGGGERTAYTASKHAVVGLTKEMAMELGDKGIRINAVGPGAIRTALTEISFQDPEYVQRIRGIHALGRWGETHEIAKAILFLASDEASFATGTTLLVDGGWTTGKRL